MKLLLQQKSLIMLAGEVMATWAKLMRRNTWSGVTVAWRRIAGCQIKRHCYDMRLFWRKWKNVSHSQGCRYDISSYLHLIESRLWLIFSRKIYNLTHFFHFSHWLTSLFCKDDYPVGHSGLKTLLINYYFWFDCRPPRLFNLIPNSAIPFTF